MTGWNPHPLMSLAILLIVHAIGFALWLWLRPRRPAPRRSSGVSVDAIAAIYKRKYSSDIVAAMAEMRSPMFAAMGKRPAAPFLASPGQPSVVDHARAQDAADRAAKAAPSISHDPGDEDRS